MSATDVILSRSWEFHLDWGSGGAPTVFIPLDRIVGVIEGNGNTNIDVGTEWVVVREDAEWVRGIVDCYNVFAPATALAEAAE